MVRIASLWALALAGAVLAGCVAGKAATSVGVSEPIPARAAAARLSGEERGFLEARRPLYDTLRRVGEHRAKDDIEQAYLLVRTLVRTHPAFEPAIHHFLELASDTDNLQEAVELFTERVQQDNGDGPAWYGLALMRDGDARVETGLRAIEAGCQSWSCYFTVATAFALDSRVDEGITWFRGWAKAHEGDTDTLVNARLAESELLRYGAGTPETVEALLLNVVSNARAGRGWEIGLERLGMLYTTLGRILDAREALALALEVHRVMGNWEGELSVLFNQVVLERKGGNLKVAAGLAEQALELSRACGELWYQARFLGLLGDIRMTLNDAGAAVACYEPEVVLDRRLGNLERLPIALAHLGLAYHALGRVEEAAEVFEKARALFDAQGEHEGAAWVERLLREARGERSDGSMRESAPEG